MRVVLDTNVVINAYLGDWDHPARVPHLALEDPPDNDVIATAVAGEAEYIVLGDDDLHRLGTYQGKRTPYCRKLRSKVNAEVIWSRSITTKLRASVREKALSSYRTIRARARLSSSAVTRIMLVALRSISVITRSATA
jgi:hypothetical protein